MDSRHDRDLLKQAYRFLALLQRENAQLHAVLRQLGQLVDDMNNNCSYEVFEHEWAEITLAMAKLSEFFSSHQKDLAELKDSDIFNDEVDEV
ncbi:hypothetical protein EBQ81_04225 [bacterium]|nr:hypothetical protein [bacterium]